MTPQEALELVEQCGLNIEGIVNIECENLIVSALEKRIPKKPIKLGFNPLELICSVSYICPNCNKHVSITPYCSSCGQALDWGDDK